MVAAVLFVTGAVGVLIRRSPLIVLLSLEIMLNGGNLALIAMARHQGGLGGQIFALAVMAVAASEVVVGLGLIVAMARRHLDLDVDKLSHPPRMITASWICLLQPARGRARDHAARPRGSRGAAPGSSRTGSVLVSFIGALVAFIALLGREAPTRARTSPPAGTG